MDFKIALAGDLGSGKSTVAALLSQKTGAEIYSTGRICRALAEQKGLPIDRFNVYMETHPEVDREIDDGLIALSARKGKLIIDSRMAWHFVTGCFSVYLSTDPRISAERILKDQRSGESFSTVEEAMERIAARRESEDKRYYEKYGVRIKDMRSYDFVLDTTYISPEVVSDEILRALKLYIAGDSGREARISAERIFYRPDAVQMDLLSGRRAELRMNAPVPLPTVTEKDGRYYLTGSAEAALAYTVHGVRLLPCRIDPCPPDLPSDGYYPLTEFSHI